MNSVLSLPTSIAIRGASTSLREEGSAPEIPSSSSHQQRVLQASERLRRDTVAQRPCARVAVAAVEFGKKEPDRRFFHPINPRPHPRQMVALRRPRCEPPPPPGQRFGPPHCDRPRH